MINDVRLIPNTKFTVYSRETYQQGIQFETKLLFGIVIVVTCTDKPRFIRKLLPPLNGLQFKPR